jgi:hypothetical protein
MTAGRLICIAFVSLALVSCDKGYRLRFANYYPERMDTVLVSNMLFFSGIEPQKTTDYKPITKGHHDIRCVSKSGKIFTTAMHIPSSGSGDRTLQIDAISQVSILEK